MADDRIFGSIGDLKIGKYVIVDDHPCRVVSMDKSKPGKHGAAKVNIVAISLSDSSKHSLMKPSDATVEIPIVNRKRAQIVSVSGVNAQLMDLETFETFEVEIPEEVKNEVESGKEIEYMEVMGKKILGRIYQE
ncbi:MAG: translation initiation factor IF-5A [Candidatus Marsarchaeota archaeon]|nr:translation initiation factor IF-5A [Candidatus Marsarchaeota archaeon]